MSEAAQRPRDFDPVSETEASKFLWEAAKTTAAAMVWTKDQKHVLQTHLSRYSPKDKHLYAWIPPGFDVPKFNDEMADLGAKECFFSVSLSRANIFFKTLFLGFDDGGLRFALPEKLFKVQRRKDLRYSIPDGYVMKVQFEDPLFPGQVVTHKVIDLSAGGLAFLVTDNEAPVFTQGLLLKNLAFTLQARRIIADAEVRHLRPFDDGARHVGVKVGALFNSIKESDKQAVASYVFEETRKFYSKFI